jgi:hypothetical protein
MQKVPKVQSASSALESSQGVFTMSFGLKFGTQGEGTLPIMWLFLGNLSVGHTAPKCFTSGLFYGAQGISRTKIMGDMGGSAHVLQCSAKGRGRDTPI